MYMYVYMYSCTIIICIYKGYEPARKNQYILCLEQQYNDDCAVNFRNLMVCVKKKLNPLKNPLQNKKILYWKDFSLDFWQDFSVSPPNVDIIPLKVSVRSMSD